MFDGYGQGRFARTGDMRRDVWRGAAGCEFECGPECGVQCGFPRNRQGPDVTFGNVRIADALIRRVEQHAARRGVIDEEPVMLRAGYTQSASIDFRECKYRRIKYEDRCQIYALSKRVEPRKHRRSFRQSKRVSREIHRNRGERGYRFKQAEAKAQARQAIRSKPRKLTVPTRSKIEAKLRQMRWSPEQISGWLSEQGIKLSHERIYQMIWDDKRDGGNLWRSLRRRGKRYNKRAGKNAGRGLIPNKIDISERPAIVARKTRLGDWEGDTVVSAGHKGGLLTLVERKTQLAKITKLPRATARATQKAAVRCLQPIGDFVHTITFDNGKEFAAHQDIAHALKTKIFFATPYHAWERGLNENTNGLIRDFFPKGTDFSTISSAEVAKVERLLNARPRKSLGFRSPQEVFHSLAYS